MSKVFTVLQDTREQRPLVFPARMVVQNPAVRHEAQPMTVKVEVRKVALPTADYTGLLDGAVYSPDADRGVCVIETKRGVSEIADNAFGKRREPFLRELQKLRTRWRYPVLLLEGELSMDGVAAPAKGRLNYPAECVFDEFLRLCFEHGLVVHVMPPNRTSRLYVGAYAARLLWAASHAGAHHAEGNSGQHADHRTGG
jgi:hypothetical protein